VEPAAPTALVCAFTIESQCLRTGLISAAPPALYVKVVADKKSRPQKYNVLVCVLKGIAGRLGFECAKAVAEPPHSKKSELRVHLKVDTTIEEAACPSRKALRVKSHPHTRLLRGGMDVYGVEGAERID